MLDLVHNVVAVNGVVLDFALEEVAYAPIELGSVLQNSVLFTSCTTWLPSTVSCSTSRWKKWSVTPVLMDCLLQDNVVLALVHDVVAANGVVLDLALEEVVYAPRSSRRPAPRRGCRQRRRPTRPTYRSRTA